MKPSDAQFQYGFRPVTRADLPLLGRWLAEPHVRKWWAEPAKALQSIESHIDSISVEPFIVELDGKPIGYIQSYDPHLEDAHPYQDQPTGTLGIDQFIGEAALIGKGHGTRLIEAFVEQLFEEGAIRVIIDPDPANAAAIRAYEKAGFERFDTRHSKYGPALMLARNADGDFA
ncbi:GNAT family N-acetyltransferase [Devosia sp. LjRoot16]|uniref:GNAT family N-acetyltransferase n=1 Tax=unclassified Devosia TaxID=196773 RepID=UPI0006F6A175|nr:GNAT family N-acetyltransferase [Devosia sp. Root105]KQV09290.1 aminoglycoside adenylyltransferase [Devosia sp. Root105]